VTASAPSDKRRANKLSRRIAQHERVADAHADAALGKMNDFVGVIAPDAIPRERTEPFRLVGLDDFQQFNRPVLQISREI
jgi:hypothetical protein